MIKARKVLLTVLVLTSLGFSMADPGGVTIPKPKPSASTFAFTD